jgi:hypothetical protein
MKTLTLILAILLCCGLMVNFGIKETYGENTYSKTDFPQPSPLVLDVDSNFKVQPIVENIDLKGYEFIMTFKLYYKDKMVKPIDLKKGSPIDGYCSDLTLITFYFSNGDSLNVESVKRMSCKILAIFNLEKYQNQKLKNYPINSIKVVNHVTENKYIFPVKDKMYFSRLINQYPHWR